MSKKIINCIKGLRMPFPFILALTYDHLMLARHRQLQGSLSPTVLDVDVCTLLNHYFHYFIVALNASHVQS